MPAEINAHRLKMHLADEQATIALGQALARVAAQLTSNPSGNIEPGPLASGRIHLSGELGSGKTALTRALLRECGVTGRIKSPSYALVESYQVSSLYLYHLDFYRFSDPKEWLDAGFKEILTNNALVLIEWPERAGELLGVPDMLIELSYAGDGRIASLTAPTKKGVSWLTNLTTHLDTHPRE